MAQFFINRPIFAWVISIVIMLAGGLSIYTLPLEQYPDIAPPRVTIGAQYTGASAETVENSVTQIIEQQLKGNTLLERLVEAQKSTQSTQALMLVGRTAVVDGSDASLAKGGSAVWNLRSPKSATATVSVRNVTGQLVYSATRALNSGDTSFAWDGQASNGAMCPPGQYKLVVDAKDIGGKPIAVAAEAQGVVESVDLTKSPIMLSIGGRNYPLDSVRRVIHASARV